MGAGPSQSPSFPEPRRIALWAVPRSVSTAFERVFIERDDAEVLHEPFSYAYYHGPERRSDRFGGVEPRPEHAYDAVMADTLAAPDAPILFMKDMAYQAEPVRDPAFFASFANTFLIRRPEEALLSLHRMWPDFTFEEAGFARQEQLFDLVTGSLEQSAVVVDAADFRRDPEGTMEAYCAAVGIEHRADALSWEAGAIPQWRDWAEWHRDAEQSSRILPPAATTVEELPPRVERMVELCRPHYDRLHAERLTV